MKKVLVFVLKFVNVKGMALEAVDIHLEKFVMAAVAKSENKIDDAVVPLIYQAIEKEALEYINENLDPAKLLGKLDEPKA